MEHVEMHTEFRSENLRRPKDDGRMGLICGKAWVGFISLKIGTSGGLSSRR